MRIFTIFLLGLFTASLFSAEEKKQKDAGVLLKEMNSKAEEAIKDFLKKSQFTNEYIHKSVAGFWYKQVEKDDTITAKVIKTSPISITVDVVVERKTIHGPEKVAHIDFTFITVKNGQAVSHGLMEP